MSFETKKLVLFSIFISSITCSLLISAKITTVMTLTFTVGALSYAVLFLITDVVSEVYGRKEANKLVYLGWLAYGLVILFSQLAILMPAASFWEQNQESYELVLGLVPRIILGSLCSYTVSQYHDIWAFHFIKKMTNGKYLWIRNNGSTVVSQLIDTIIFVLIAFYGVVPNDQLFGLIFGQYVFKIIIAIIDTPFVYLVANWARKGEEEQNLRSAYVD